MSASNIPQYDLTNITDPQELARRISEMVNAINTTLNGGIQFSNLNQQTVTVKFSQVNTTVRVPHSLKKNGVNFIIVNNDTNGNVWRDTSKSNDLGAIYLRASAPLNVILILY